MITGFENIVMLAICQIVETYEDYIENNVSEEPTDTEVMKANYVADVAITKIEKAIRILREEQEGK